MKKVKSNINVPPSEPTLRNNNTLTLIVVLTIKKAEEARCK